MTSLKPAAPAAQRVQCLVVDDLEENVLALTALLQTDDVQVLAARSGNEALEILLSHDVALALLDVQMPGMDGFELAELMRGSERTRDIPIIFLTAGSHDERRVFQGYEAGAVDFIHKPIDTHVLLNKAAVFFQLHRQKRQLAGQLRERTETLRLNEMFVAVLAHDLRNPLAAIVTSADLIQVTAEDPIVARAAEGMITSGRRMARMIDDLLDLVRARIGGGIRIQRGRCDVGPIVEGVVGEQRTAHPDREVVLIQRGNLHGDWDAGRLAQVVSNLVGNAIEHGSAGEPVRVECDGTHSAELLLAVINHGTVPSKLLPQLFDPFRSGRREETRRGLGLGLYIVRQVVEAHGGEVVVDTSEADRTAFRVRLPRRATHAAKTRG